MRGGRLTSPCGPRRWIAIRPFSAVRRIWPPATAVSARPGTNKQRWTAGCDAWSCRAIETEQLVERSFLHRKVASGPRLWLSALFLQTGVSGLFVSLLWRGPLAWLFALTIVAGLSAFFSQVAWMLRRPRPRPPKL